MTKDRRRKAEKLRSWWQDRMPMNLAGGEAADMTGQDESGGGGGDGNSNVSSSTPVVKQEPAEEPRTRIKREPAAEASSDEEDHLRQDRTLMESTMEEEEEESQRKPNLFRDRQDEDDAVEEVGKHLLACKVYHVLSFSHFKRRFKCFHKCPTLRHPQSSW